MKVIFRRPKLRRLYSHPAESPSPDSEGSEEEEPMGEEPLHTSKAHVFRIDPESRKTWIPSAEHAVDVSFYFDRDRNLYRVISLDDDKVLINSTLAEDVIFSRTSQKFGQWTDSAAGQTYGLGFQSEAELSEFVRHFDEMKSRYHIETTEVARSMGEKFVHHFDEVKSTPHVETKGVARNVGEKFVHPFEEVKSTPHMETTGVMKSEGEKFVRPLDEVKSMRHPETTTEVARNGEEKHHGGQWNDQLRYENERLKVALAQSSSNARKWEAELQQLRSTNERLTSAIRESSANVDEWNRQLSSLKEENARLKLKVIEMEKTTGTCSSLEAQLDDVIGRLSRAEKLLSTKDKELVELKMKIDNLQQVDVVSKRTKVQYQMSEEENARLKGDVACLHEELRNLNVHKDSQSQELRSLQSRFNAKMAELMEINEKISELV